MSISVPPWRVDEIDNICSNDDFAVAIAWTTDDARLIAAAPDMLEALRAALKFLEHYADPEANELWGKVGSVIAKATGISR